MKNKLLLIDGLNVIRRVHGANPSPDTPEKAQGAIKASHQSLLRALSEHRPTHCALLLDPPGKYWRHEIYPLYKSTRSTMDESLAAEIEEYISWPARAIKAVLRTNGFEAEDMMASLAVQALQQDFEVVLLSTDKDILSLLAYGAQAHNHFTGEWMDAAWCESKFGVTPLQLTDFLALTGDASDDIPGVKGVGIKTAAKLLGEFSTLEAILENSYQIKGAVGKRLQTEEEQSNAKLSKTLVSLRLDAVPPFYDLNTLRVD